MHHLGIGIAHHGKEVLALADPETVTVMELRTGEVLSTHDIDPARGYWRTSRKARADGPGLLSPKTRLICLACRDSTHGGAEGI
jgi:hypothetical protein